MAFTFKATTYQATLKPGLYHAKLADIELREGDLGPRSDLAFSHQSERGPGYRGELLIVHEMLPQSESARIH